VIRVISDFRINVCNDLITIVEDLDGANYTNFIFLVSNIKLAFCNSKDRHFSGFEGLITDRTFRIQCR